MTNRLLSALAVIAVLGVASCGSPSTPDFVRKAALNDLFEVEAGMIAAEKGQSEGVKEFGRHMVEAHRKSTEELRGIVESEKLNVKLPTTLDHRHQKMIDALNEATPDDFDQTYAMQQIRALESTAGLFDDYAEEGKNEALKQFAANVLPNIRRHRSEAAELAP
jgi:putative membrane protein